MIEGKLRPAKSAIIREVSDARLSLNVLKMPFAWGVIGVSLVGTAVFFIGLSGIVGWVLGQMEWLQSGWLAKIPWLNVWVGGFGVIAALVVAWFLYPLVVTGIAGMFLEPLADRIESEHYEMVPKARQVKIAEQVRASLVVMLRAIGWNLLVLPLYMIPFVNLVVYFILNAFLLSREYYQVIAVRHMPLAETKAIYQVHRAAMFRGGLVLALIFLIPVVNLVAPLLATSWMVHRVWRKPSSPLRKWLVEREEKQEQGGQGYE